MKTRTLVVPFSQPSTGPINAEEDAAYEEFENNLLNHYYSSTMGWVVGLRKTLIEEGKAKIQNTKLQLQKACVMKTRNITGCSIAMFVLEQVSHEYTCIKIYIVYVCTCMIEITDLSILCKAINFEGSNFRGFQHFSLSLKILSSKF